MRHLIWLPLLFIFFSFPCELALLSTKHHLCPHDQMHALLQFKDMFSIYKYDSYGCDFGSPDFGSPKTMYWNNKSANNGDCCLWDGVTCDRETGDVIELDLSCSQLFGTISPNSSIGIFRLTHLRRLNLAYNNFNNSHISPAFGRFTHLTHLSLSNSRFTGSVPPDISFLSKLVSLDLSYNDQDLTLEANDFSLLLKNLTHLKELILRDVWISSSIPNSLMNLSSLEVLDLSWTGLQGILPGQIFMLPHLRELKLGWNTLKGDFPKTSAINTSSLQILELGGWNALSAQRGVLDSIWNLTSLRGLDLSYTQFTEKLSDSIGSLESLTYLYLYFCDLTGAIPKSLGNLTEITHLELSHNSFHSQIPITILNMKKLVSLDLGNNRLTGPMPPNSTGLQKLQVLKLGDNMINGTLPPWLFTLPSLVELHMNSNQLTGPIPGFNNELSLRILDLSNNQLQGPLPHSMMNLVNLTLLQLSSNNLSGIVEQLIFSKLKHLDHLIISRNFFQGSFPLLPMSIGQFSASYNKFSGNIPSSVCNNTELRSLDVSYNDLGGAIPQCLLNISNLRSLILETNRFNGNIPSVADPGINLKVFLASHNKFTGNIASSMCNLTSLDILDVSYNDLGEVIPPCLVNNYVSGLDLQKNRFTGTIPPPICANGTKLKTLNLNGNHLEGHVPKYLANCKSLELVDLGRNRLNGSFPHWLESLPELQVLVLHSNKFQGPIGKSRTKSPYPKLRIFDLSDNEFSGRLPIRYFQHFTAMKNSNETEGGPKYMEDENAYYQDSIEITWKGVESEFKRILTTLATIDLSANRFEGEIPEVLQELISLRLLNLSQNNLTGPIPTSLGNLANLETLDLSSNILTGKIPIDLASITGLAMFNVSNNHLVGLIPRGKQFNTFENNSYVGNSGLCGFPLSNSCGDNKEPPSPPKVTQQKEDQSIFSGEFTWKIVLFGYGCGVPVGLILEFLMLYFGWPRWFQKIGETESRRKVKRPKGVADRPRRRRNLR